MVLTRYAKVEIQRIVSCQKFTARLEVKVCYHKIVFNEEETKKIETLKKEKG